MSTAEECYDRSVKLLQEGGFNLRSWSTNNKTLYEKTCQDNLHESKTTVKVFGMMWNTVTDELHYSAFKSEHCTQLNTKREIVRITSSLFDPLGALSPVHIKAKSFIQKLWLSGINKYHPS